MTDYAVTLRHWHDRLDEHLDEAERLAGARAPAGLAALSARRAPRLRRRLHGRLPAEGAQGRPERRRGRRVAGGRRRCAEAPGGGGAVPTRPPAPGTAPPAPLQLRWAGPAPRSPRPGLQLRRGRRAARHLGGDARADRRAGDPAGMAGGVDLPRPAGPPPGDRRSTPPGASSTSTTRPGAKARPREVRSHDRFRAGAPAAAPRMSLLISPARARASRASACWRAPWRSSTSGSSGSGARSTRRPTEGSGFRRSGSSTSPSQTARWCSTIRARAGSATCSGSRTRPAWAWSASSNAAAAAGPRCSPIATGAAGLPYARMTSTTTSRPRWARTSVPRTSAPGTRRWSRPSPSRPQGGGADTKAARKRAIDGAVRQVAEALGNTPAVRRRAYIDQRVIRPLPLRVDDRRRRFRAAWQPGVPAGRPPAVADRTRGARPAGRRPRLARPGRIA